MRSGIPYKNCLINGESFQRESNGRWTAQYLVTRLNAGSERTGFPSQQYQLNEVFATENEADAKALFCDWRAVGDAIRDAMKAFALEPQESEHATEDK